MSNEGLRGSQHGGRCSRRGRRSLCQIHISKAQMELRGFENHLQRPRPTWSGAPREASCVSFKSPSQASRRQIKSINRCSKCFALPQPALNQQTYAKSMVNRPQLVSITICSPCCCATETKKVDKRVRSLRLEVELRRATRALGYPWHKLNETDDKEGMNWMRWLLRSCLLVDGKYGGIYGADEAAHELLAV